MGWYSAIIRLPKRNTCADDLKSPIAVKEAKAILNTLLVFSKEVYNCRVDAYVDNMNLVNFWNNEGGRSMPLTNVIKELFELSLKLNISPKLQYIPSDQNLADQPSRILSDIDCSLSVNAWSRVESAFGPHTVDLRPYHQMYKKLRVVGSYCSFRHTPAKNRWASMCSLNNFRTMKTIMFSLHLL